LLVTDRWTPRKTPSIDDSVQEAARLSWTQNVLLKKMSQFLKWGYSRRAGVIRSYRLKKLILIAFTPWLNRRLGCVNLEN
jgi:hypothetical protein